MTEKNRNVQRRPATRRSQLLETLENRQLMAAFSADFNFQPASSSKPSGYIADTGKTFSTQGGYQFGWNANNTSNVVDRYTSADARYDTFAYLGKSGATKWEVAVPNGTYRVNITAGDASSNSAHYALKVENSQLINETPSQYNRWSEGSGSVTVTDGRLTITSGTGAYNNKITSVSIKQTSTSGTGSSGAGLGLVTPKAPSWAGAWNIGTRSLTLGWGDASSNESGFIVERSTNGTSFSEVARLTANKTQTDIASLSPGTSYYYRVRAYNGNGSAASPTTRVTTLGSASPVTPVTVVPSKPSSISSNVTNASSGKITWTDASNNETGFIVQKSTNNSTFTEAGRVGANTTSFTASGLNASTKYYFRVLAYNSAGNSTASSVSSFTTAAVVGNGNTGGNTGGSTGSGSTGTITNKLSLSGISANTNGDPASSYVEVLNDVGIKNVRIWYSFKNWNAQPDTWYINRVMSYKNAGYKVMLAVLNPNVPSSEAQAKTFFNRLTSYPGLTGAVDYWQINNEPNMGSFWHGSLAQYVKLNLKPAYEVLKAKGEVVVGAGPSWDVNAAKTLTANGYLNYCDYAAFHPYGENANIVIQRARDARAAYNNKPMMVTEWNIQGVSNQTNWVTELNKAAVGLSNIAAMNYYFALKQSATHVGTGGLLKYDGSRNTLFYNAVKGWLD